MLNTPKPIVVTSLFSEIQDELIQLLISLTEEDWKLPTTCGDWVVKDVAVHLLGGDIGNLSRRRDGLKGETKIDSWEQLVSFINTWNKDWVKTLNRVSTRVLIDLMVFIGPQMSEFFASLDPTEMGGPVSWVGPDPAPVWMDLAREYTERWHHQQHIRDAVGKPGLKQPKYFTPVIDAFIRALPRTYVDIPSKEGTTVVVQIAGNSGGMWSIRQEKGLWQLYTGAPSKPDAFIQIDQDDAWRLFTRELSKSQIQYKVGTSGDQRLADNFYKMVSIIA